MFPWGVSTEHSGTQTHTTGSMTKSFYNPLAPHDALKHHFTSRKTALISL